MTPCFKIFVETVNVTLVAHKVVVACLLQGVAWGLRSAGQGQFAAESNLIFAVLGRTQNETTILVYSVFFASKNYYFLLVLKHAHLNGPATQTQVDNQGVPHLVLEKESLQLFDYNYAEPLVCFVDVAGSAIRIECNRNVGKLIDGVTFAVESFELIAGFVLSTQNINVFVAISDTDVASTLIIHLIGPQ